MALQLSVRCAFGAHAFTEVWASSFLTGVNSCWTAKSRLTHAGLLVGVGGD